MSRAATLINHLEKCMEGQLHIDRPEYVWDVVDKLNTHFVSMDNDQREYLHIATTALDQGIKWNSNKSVVIIEDDGYVD